ncbi:MAG: cytochrome c [Acidobacteriaceae bacterium]|jgi:mono/diheme cytochrome c family protein
MNKSMATISPMLLVGTASFGASIVLLGAFILLLGALFSPNPSAAQSSAAYTPANAHAGEQVFLQKCFQCHSVNPGEVRIGPTLFHVMKGPKAVPAAQIRIQLRDGKGKMPPFKDLLTPEDVDHVIAYLHTL